MGSGVATVFMHYACTTQDCRPFLTWIIQQANSTAPPLVCVCVCVRAHIDGILLLHPSRLRRDRLLAWMDLLILDILDNLNPNTQPPTPNLQPLKRRCRASLLGRRNTNTWKRWVKRLWRESTRSLSRRVCGGCLSFLPPATALCSITRASIGSVAKSPQP